MPMPVTTHQNRINVIKAVPEAYVPKLTCVCDPTREESKAINYRPALYARLAEALLPKIKFESM